MTKTRDNHFVAQWYQRGFFDERENELCYLTRRSIEVPGREPKIINSRRWHTPTQQFKKLDLYSTFFGSEINDDIERKLFGAIDDSGSKSVRAFLTDDESQWHHSFQDFFIYMDAQKLRTPKGLDWIKTKYASLSQSELMNEMQLLRMIHCTTWAEGVRELVSAEDSSVKFITSDHPVTIYNYACPPESSQCEYPNDPDILLKASQTIFPLNKDRCLILTNLEYAKDSEGTSPLVQKINPARVRHGLVNTVNFINSRKLTAEDVAKINFIIKTRARSTIAGGKEEWLMPESFVECSWEGVRSVLLPPKSELYKYGGEMYAHFDDGSVLYQDAFGRTTPRSEHLDKKVDESKLGRNDSCGCGSGRKYKICCLGVPVDLRADWGALSIRERHLVFCNCIRDVLGLENGLNWIDVQRGLSEEQIKEIYSCYSTLWPRDENIYSLLPKPDKKYRGLYTGVVDVRAMVNNVLPKSSMFDEFLIAMPIVSPNNIRSEFNPLDNPGRYKYQALKDFLFMLTVEPFIARGLINLIPDPSDFDLNLLRAVLDMARGRDKARADELACAKEVAFQQSLLLEDLINSMPLMPDSAINMLLVKQFKMREEDAAAITGGMSSYTKNSPLALLQKSPAEEAGQFLQIRFLPNYEMSLFLAQVTGSVLVTDSKTRWLEVQGAQHRNQGVVNYPWRRFSEQMTHAPIDHEMSIHFQKSGGHFSAARDLLKSADKMVLEGDRDAARALSLADRARNYASLLARPDNAISTNSLKILSPDGGFYDNTVQRLLARSSCAKYDQSVRSMYGFGIDV